MAVTEDVKGRDSQVGCAAGIGAEEDEVVRSLATKTLGG